MSQADPPGGLLAHPGRGQNAGAPALRAFRDFRGARHGARAAQRAGPALHGIIPRADQAHVCMA